MKNTQRLKNRSAEMLQFKHTKGAFNCLNKNQNFNAFFFKFIDNK